MWRRFPTLSGDVALNMYLAIRIEPVSSAPDFPRTLVVFDNEEQVVVLVPFEDVWQEVQKMDAEIQISVEGSQSVFDPTGQGGPTADV